MNRNVVSSIKTAQNHKVSSKKNMDKWTAINYSTKQRQKQDKREQINLPAQKMERWRDREIRQSSRSRGERKNEECLEGLRWRSIELFPQVTCPWLEGKKKKNTDQLIALVGTAIQHAVKNTAGYTKNMNCICCTPSRPDRLDCHWHCCILSSPWHWRLSFLTLRRVGRSTHYPIGQLEGPACVSKRKWGVHNQQWGPEVLVLDRLSYHESSCILCVLYGVLILYYHYCKHNHVLKSTGTEYVVKRLYIKVKSTMSFMLVLCSLCSIMQYYEVFPSCMVLDYTFLRRPG